MKPNEKENIYTDEVNYDDASDVSVWGTEDKATTGLLERIPRQARDDTN